ncbi:hypothetical protein ASG41_21955 [Modestobacter sp. Leaf380]|nr:hypothetical protein ASG41_21955 [Modestobacter sp. Leaf380]
MGLFFAGWQLRLLRAQRDREREVEQRGVAVMWRAKDVPTTADADGSSAASYEFTVYNPGKLPVRDVVVSVELPIEVRREHYDSSVDPTTSTLTLDTPVIAGGQHRVWVRRLRMQFDDRDRMRRMQCTVTFADLEGKTYTNLWGRGPRE